MKKAIAILWVLAFSAAFLGGSAFAQDGRSGGGERSAPSRERGNAERESDRRPSPQANTYRQSGGEHDRGGRPEMNHDRDRDSRDGAGRDSDRQRGSQGGEGEHRQGPPWMQGRGGFSGRPGGPGAQGGSGFGGNPEAMNRMREYFQRNGGPSAEGIERMREHMSEMRDRATQGKRGGPSAERMDRVRKFMMQQHQQQRQRGMEGMRSQRGGPSANSQRRPSFGGPMQGRSFGPPSMSGRRGGPPSVRGSQGGRSHGPMVNRSRDSRGSRGPASHVRGGRDDDRRGGKRSGNRR